MSKDFERLFFALWPDDGVRNQLIKNYRNFEVLNGQGRVLADTNLHMTLHFLGNVALKKIDCFTRQAKKISIQPFTLQLTRSGYFKKPRIVWIGPDKIPERLSLLQQNLGELISSCGFNPEQRPYRPHVTMARKIQGEPGELFMPPINWQINHFALVQSNSVAGGVEYRVRQSFSLTG